MTTTAPWWWEIPPVSRTTTTTALPRLRHLRRINGKRWGIPTTVLALASKLSKGVIRWNPTVVVGGGGEAGLPASRGTDDDGTIPHPRRMATAILPDSNNDDDSGTIPPPPTKTKTAETAAAEGGTIRTTTTRTRNETVPDHPAGIPGDIPSELAESGTIRARRTTTRIRRGTEPERGGSVTTRTRTGIPGGIGFDLGDRGMAPPPRTTTETVPEGANGNRAGATIRPQARKAIVAARGDADDGGGGNAAIRRTAAPPIASALPRANVTIPTTTTMTPRRAARRRGPACPRATRPACRTTGISTRRSETSRPENTGTRSAWSTSTGWGRPSTATRTAGRQRPRRRTSSRRSEPRPSRRGVSTRARPRRRRAPPGSRRWRSFSDRPSPGTGTTTGWRRS
mmetsp:Transcript_25343/g.59319  ORF Transcript_25343/g.59319 Transcript_25343/m.59319 type:complete len:398 (-) Transcript_25343:478-1671(-)